MNSKRQPIHRWDRAILLKALLWGAILEAFIIAPAILSPWGHAGPESLLGWVNVLLNTPGLSVLWLLGTLFGGWKPGPVVSVVASVYLAQTFIITYIAFVLMRWKKRRTKGLV